MLSILPYPHVLIHDPSNVIDHSVSDPITLSAKKPAKSMQVHSPWVKKMVQRRNQKAGPTETFTCFLNGLAF